MHDYGCCFVLTLHPWLSGRPSRVRLLEELVMAMQEKGEVWFARGREIAGVDGQPSGGATGGGFRFQPMMPARDTWGRRW